MPIGVLDADHAWDVDGLLCGNATGAVWEHQSTSGLDLPAYRISDEPHPQEHGVFFLGPDYMEARIIEQTWILDSSYGETFQDQMDILKSKMGPRSDKYLFRWRYNNKQARRLSVRPRRCEFELDDLAYRGALLAHLAWTAEDPIIYDDLEQIFTMLPSSTSGGLGFPHDFPHGFGSTTSSQQIITNEGSWPTPIYGRITAGGDGITGWSIENLTIGEIFSMTTPLNAGDFMDFDFSPKVKTVLLAGTASRTLDIDRPFSSWWKLVPGDNEVIFRVEGPSGGTASIDVRARSAWV